MLQLRNYLDPKSFYKSSDFKKMPSYFQVGTIVEGGDDFVGGRLHKKEKRNKLIDLFLSEDQKINFSKRKFLDIQADKLKKTKRRKPNSKLNRLKKMGNKIKKK